MIRLWIEIIVEGKIARKALDRMESDLLFSPLMKKRPVCTKGGGGAKEGETHCNELRI